MFLAQVPPDIHILADILGPHSHKPMVWSVPIELFPVLQVVP